MPKVLILEDNPLIALDLAMTVEDVLAADVVVAGTLANAWKVDPNDVDVAILDVNIGSATSFDFARELVRAGVLVAFASGYQLSRIPDDLSDVLFLSKPCSRSAMVAFVEGALGERRASG